MFHQTRMKVAEKQRRWRQVHGVTPVTVHLDERDLATLDAIAISLYYEYPHDPAIDRFASVYPGRAQAIRELCARWRKLNNEEPENILGSLCSQLGAFFTREASWRRSKGEHRARRPKPPWYGGSAIVKALGPAQRLAQSAPKPGDARAMKNSTREDR